MKAIEKRIVKALRDGASFKQSANVYGRGYVVHDEVKADSLDRYYYLIGTLVARYTPSSKKLILGVEDARYDTITTRSRINAIASAFGVKGVRRLNGESYWDDGASYDGPRSFDL